MPQYSGVFTLQQQMQALTSGQWATDPNFRNTSLLIQADGAANGAQNNTFLDTSPNQFVITRNGNTTQGTFSPFSPFWSAYFDGAGDYVDVPSGASISGTGDFTVEAWIFPLQLNAGVAILQANTTVGGLTGMLINSNGTIGMGRANIDVQASSISTVALNAWNHVAVTRQSGTVRIFINGIQGYSGTITTSYNAGTVRFGIEADGTSNPYRGYISNYRSISGTAIYTANFTPSPLPLTAVTGTSLLTFQSNRFVDNSAANYTVTKSGDTSIQPFSPFAPQYQWTAPVIGGSAYFDGNGDYLTAPNSNSFDLSGSISWCVETWAYWWTTGGEQNIIEQFTNPSGPGWTLYKFATNAGTPVGTLDFYGGSSFNSGVVPVAGQWYHIVVCRDNTAGRTSWFVNGTRTATTTTFTIGGKAASAALTLGVRNGGTTYLGAYLSGTRVIKGSTPYDPSQTSIALPTTPPTSVTNTQFLANYTNAGIYDGTMKNILETVGNAQISTIVVKYGSGSIYFDGSGDWVQAPDTTNLQFGNGDFTIECWANLSALGTERAFLAKLANTGTTGSFLLEVNTSNIIKFYASSNTTGTWDIVSGLGSIAINANIWTHIAVTRQGSLFTVWVNGVSAGTASSTGTLVNSGVVTTVGAVANGGFPFLGYIDDVRFTKGIARYTQNFIPPSVALPRQ